jgi:UDP-glucuronate decarboxylase
MILTSFGDGNQTRAFLYVSDWTEATKRMKRMLFTQGLKGEVFNVGPDNLGKRKYKI